MASLNELINLSKYQSGYHGDGPQQKTPNVSGIFGGDLKNNKQAIGLKLLQFKAQLDKMQADAAIAKRKQDLWNSVGTPAVSDKSTAGDVANIVDTEKVGGRDADIVNRGDTFSIADPQDKQSDSTLVNLISGLQPKINPSGDMVLGKKPKPKSTYQGVAKKYDEARTFNYAKRLADQEIIASGKSKKEITPADYSVIVKKNMGKAEKYLYGQQLSQDEPPAKEPINQEAAAIVKSVQTGIDFGNTPAPGEQTSAPQVQAYGEGQTAINPKTGKRLVFKGGKWQALN